MPMEIKGGVIAPTSVTCDNCEVKGHCKFHLKRQGGFKGPGQPARHVGYLLITDAAEGHRTTRSFMACPTFVQLLQPRQDLGRQRIEEGKDGEIIEIIGMEGDVIEMRAEMGINARGEIVQPMAEYVAGLKASGHKVNLDDRSPAVGFAEVKWKMTIPPLKGIKPASAYDQEVYAEALARRKAQEEAEDLPWNHGRETPQVDFHANQQAQIEGPISEPVKRGPGRPRKDAQIE